MSSRVGKSSQSIIFASVCSGGGEVDTIDVGSTGTVVEAGLDVGCSVVVVVVLVQGSKSRPLR